MYEDKGLAPGLDRITFQKTSEMIENILRKEVVSDPKEIAILEHGLALIEWYLSGDQRDIFKTSEEILAALHFSPEEIIAINVFFRKRRAMLESLKKEIEKKIAQGRGKEVKINAGN